MDENTILIIQDGQEKKMDIVFTFDSEQYGKQYVVFTNPEDDEECCYAMSFNDSGDLFPIEDDAEWDMVEEVIETFNAEFEE